MVTLPVLAVRCRRQSARHAACQAGRRPQPSASGSGVAVTCCSGPGQPDPIFCIHVVFVVSGGDYHGGGAHSLAVIGRADGIAGLAASAVAAAVLLTARGRLAIRAITCEPHVRLAGLLLVACLAAVACGGLLQDTVDRPGGRACPALLSPRWSRRRRGCRGAAGSPTRPGPPPGMREAAAPPPPVPGAAVPAGADRAARQLKGSAGPLAEYTELVFQAIHQM
jgi:hypothetical protein